jgi:hypothetical protein
LRIFFFLKIICFPGELANGPDPGKHGLFFVTFSLTRSEYKTKTSCGENERERRSDRGGGILVFFFETPFLH